MLSTNNSNISFKECSMPTIVIGRRKHFRKLLTVRLIIFPRTVELGKHIVWATNRGTSIKLILNLKKTRITTGLTSQPYLTCKAYTTRNWWSFPKVSIHWINRLFIFSLAAMSCSSLSLSISFSKLITFNKKQVFSSASTIPMNRYLKQNRITYLRF